MDWKTPLRGRLRTWLVVAASAAGCSREAARTPTWSSDGGSLGQRVRDGHMSGVTHVSFFSSTLKRDVGAVIVTPPGYDTGSERRYPVVYVFPGIGGDEWTYLRDVGLESAATKALFAEPAHAPILVFGNPGDSGGHQEAQVVLSEELVRFVDAHYRTRTDASGRSLEGFSLGGATVLTLLLHRPDVFGQASASSSACYLLSSCKAQRAALVAQAKRHPKARVLLSVGERESAQNRAIGEELAPLLGVKLEIIDGTDHDWAAQIASIGQRIASFHLAGFARTD